MSIRKYLMCRIWKVNNEDIDNKWIKEHYLDTKRLINYFNLKKSIREIDLDKSKFINKNKLERINKMLVRLGIDISNKKTCIEIDSTKFEEVKKDLIVLLSNREFRQLFDLEKLKSKMSDRQYLETLKSIIYDYGFEFKIESKRIKENKKQRRINSYNISLCSNILELYTRCENINEIIELDF
jgi:hypothetical protein